MPLRRCRRSKICRKTLRPTARPHRFASPNRSRPVRRYGSTRRRRTLADDPRTSRCCPRICAGTVRGNTDQSQCRDSTKCNANVLRTRRRSNETPRSCKRKAAIFRACIGPHRTRRPNDCRSRRLVYYSRRARGGGGSISKLGASRRTSSVTLLELCKPEQHCFRFNRMLATVSVAVRVR